MMIRAIEIIITIMIVMNNRRTNSNNNDSKNRDYSTNNHNNHSSNAVTAGTQTFNGPVPNEDSHMVRTLQTDVSQQSAMKS